MDATTLSTLIDSIYDAGLGGRSWQAVMSEVAAAFGERGGILYEFDAKRGQSQVLGATAVDPRAIVDYEQYYGSIDDWNRRILQEPTQHANATHNLILDAELERTEFCNDYLRPLDYFYAMGAIVRRRADRTTVFGVQRSRRRGHYDQRDFDAMTILIRHVDRSLEISERLRHADGHPNVVGDRGIALLDAGDKVVFATDATLGLLARAGMALSDGRLAAKDAAGRKLEDALRRIRAIARHDRSTAEALDIPLPDGGRLSLVVQGSATAIDGAAGFASLVVELRRPPRHATALLQERYRATPAEAALALALADGHSLRDIAEKRGVSINTLRVQLQSVFAKTGCHRQGDLMRLVLQLRHR